MGPSDQEEQAERRRVALQDADWRRQQKEAAKAAEQPATMHGFAVSEANLDIGRYSAATGKPTVTGSAPTSASQYPAASPALQVELPPEPPLGFENSALESPTDVSTSAPVAPAPDDAPTVIPSVEQRSGAGPSMVAQRSISQMASPARHRAGRPPDKE
jgi:hypothetical protein